MKNLQIQNMKMLKRNRYTALVINLLTPLLPLYFFIHFFLIDLASQNLAGANHIVTYTSSGQSKLPEWLVLILVLGLDLIVNWLMHWFSSRQSNSVVDYILDDSNVDFEALSLSQVPKYRHYHTMFERLADYFEIEVPEIYILKVTDKSKAQYDNAMLWTRDNGKRLLIVTDDLFKRYKNSELEALLAAEFTLSLSGFNEYIAISKSLFKLSFWIGWLLKLIGVQSLMIQKWHEPLVIKNLKFANEKAMGINKSQKAYSRALDKLAHSSEHFVNFHYNGGSNYAVQAWLRPWTKPMKSRRLQFLTGARVQLQKDLLNKDFDVKPSKK